MSDGEWRDESAMLDRVVDLLAPAALEARIAAGHLARAMPHSTLAAMADATFAVYENALLGAAPVAPTTPLDRARVRDALGYRPWHAPAARAEATAPATTPAAPVHAGVGARVARAALAIRNTPFGRALYWMAPQSLLDALKARLKT